MGMELDDPRLFDRDYIHELWGSSSSSFDK